MSLQNNNKKTLCRPIISSLAFNNHSLYLPFSYDFTIQQIQQIKKYLPKNMFKFYGIDIQGQTITKQEQEQLQKSKIKIKAKNGKWTQNNTIVNYIPKQQVRIIEWYNKSINLTIPFSSKSTSTQIQVSFYQYSQQQIQSYIEYYLDNFVLFKNTLNDQLYTQRNGLLLSNKLTVQQLSTQTDIVFLEWNIDKDPNDDQQQIVRVNVPVLLCLNINQTYTLQTLKNILKTDILSSVSIQLKHQFNTRVLIQGSKTKQYICLNSYCNEQNALNEEEKLRTIIGQQKTITIQTQQTKLNTKKDHKFLIMILATLVLIYFYLKIFPIHGRDENQYLKPISTHSQAQNYTLNINDQQLF